MHLAQRRSAYVKYCRMCWHSERSKDASDSGGAMAPPVGHQSDAAGLRPAYGAGR